MKHKKDWGPGYRFFECEACLHTWKDKSRDCTSLSSDPCPECYELNSPTHYEPHFEWATDKSGNLLNEEIIDEA